MKMCRKTLQAIVQLLVALTESRDQLGALMQEPGASGVQFLFVLPEDEQHVAIRSSLIVQFNVLNQVGPAECLQSPRSDKFIDGNARDVPEGQSRDSLIHRGLVTGRAVP